MTHTFTTADVFAARLELAKRGIIPASSMKIPRKLIPLFDGPADIRGAHGGRGSGKSWTFAKMAAEKGIVWAASGKSGVILCIRQKLNSLEDSSLQDVKNAIAMDPWLSSMYDVGETYIRTKPSLPGSVKFVFAGTSVNLGSIKSKSNVLLCWAEEAEDISEAAWEKIEPTIREEGSEIWATWNPETERSWVHKRIRMSKDENVKCVEINWTDNPHWTDKLERQRLKAKDEDAENYGHVWEGEFKTSFKGAYFVKQLADAKASGRIGYVDRHPNMAIRTYWDLGRKDHTAIWVVQFVDATIRVIDHIAGSGQSPGYYFAELRKRGYEGCHVGLPHDGAHVAPSSPDGLSYEDQARQAGFEPEIIKSGNKGAPMQRVDAARKVFPFVHFDKERCAAGLKSLAAYREKWDDDKQVGMGPLHDWSSHDADSFGLMCIDYQEPKQISSFNYDEARSHTGAW